MKYIVLLLFTLTLASTGFCQRSEVVIATYQYGDNPRVKNLEPFAEVYGKSVKKKTRVVSYANVQKLIDAMKKGEVDIAFINTFGFLLYREQSSTFAVAASLQLPKNSERAYQSVIVSSAKSGIKTVDDLRQRTKELSMLFVSPGSTSGNLVPRLRLAELGIHSDTVFKEVKYSNNHAATLLEVAEGKADVGAFGNEEYYKAIGTDSAIVSKVNVLWESQPIPLGPVMYSNKLTAEDVAYLLRTLLQLHRDHPQALDTIRSAWTEAKNADRFQVVNDKLYYDRLNLNSPKAMEIIKRFAQ
jgi:phosphonate transport system substrate-binding protein